MKNFQDLMVWQKAHALTPASYRGTAEFPKQEIWGLMSQIRRCSASIAANIAEGCGKPSNAEFQRFLRIATGSASELELAKDLAGFLRPKNTKNSTSPPLRSRELSDLVNKWKPIGS
jgi:four helix bundle protein